jgi:hypothetical protein
MSFRFGASATAAAVVLACAGGALVACSSFSKPEGPPCPRVAVVPELGHTTIYREGPGRDLTDVRYSAEISDARGSCNYDHAGVGIDMTVDIVGERGPAADGDGTDVQYFVAITDPQRNILAKEVFPTRIQFRPNQQRAGIREEVEERIPLPEGTVGADYSILLGFQLSPEEAARNRPEQK